MSVSLGKETEFAGTVAVVTGGSSGIGRVIAHALAGRGSLVTVVGRDRERLGRVVREIREQGGQASSRVADLADRDQVASLADEIRGSSGRLDFLIHSAGVLSVSRLEAATVEELDSQVAVNLTAPFLLTQRVLDVLKASSGQIVFLNSSVGIAARPTVGHYAATKHAQRALADSLRDEVNPAGVRVLSLYLGRTATPMQAKLCEIEGKAYRPERLLQPEDVAEIVCAALALPRTAEVTDIHVRGMMKA